MQPRLDYSAASPRAMKAMGTMDSFSTNCGLEASLLELIKTRASQINCCAYCVDMHTKDARVRGETEQRLYGLSVWRETPYYTERERAALALTEAVTLIANKHVSDEIYDQARQHFNDEELVNLMLNIVTINAWNRFCITFQETAGTYEPRQAEAVK